MPTIILIMKEPRICTYGLPKPVFNPCRPKIPSSSAQRLQKKAVRKFSGSSNRQSVLSRISESLECLISLDGDQHSPKGAIL